MGLNRMLRRAQPSLFAAVITLAATTACETPIQAHNVGYEQVYSRLNASVLTTGDPSTDAMLALRRADLEGLYDEDPHAALVQLHIKALDEDRRDRLFALSELCLHTARDTGDQQYYLASAVYAYLLLFDETHCPSPYDSRFRLLCDLYNAGLANAYRAGDDFAPRSGVRALPTGSIQVAFDQDAWTETPNLDLVFSPAADYQIQGLRARNYTPGLGAPLIGTLHGQSPDLRAQFLPEEPNFAVTAFLRIDGELEDVEFGTLKAVLELHTAFNVHEISVQGRSVPLETDTTAPLALALHESNLWDFELGAFLSADEFEAGMFMLEPYRRGKIPVVFVHGTASSPARWAEMFNELQADAVLRKRYQYWFFMYPTSNPILYSASLLRDALRNVIGTVDPEGTDDALRQMIVIGHSQGGLLTRMIVTHSGTAFWDGAIDVPFEDVEMSDADRELLGSVMFFEPMPEVERVIYICTPHRGSFVAGGWIGKLVSKLVSMPRKIVQAGKSLVLPDKDGLSHSSLKSVPTAVDNMDPESRFVKTLSRLPMSRNVVIHSIVAIDGDDEPPDGDDGVVEYSSAHLENAASEIVIRHNHSAQGHARSVAEVRRILHEALRGKAASSE